MKFAQIPEVVLHDENISAGAKMVYAELDFRAGRWAKCHVGVNGIARALKITDQQAHGLMKELVQAEVLELIAEPVGPGRAPEWRLPLRLETMGKRYYGR